MLNTFRNADGERERGRERKGKHQGDERESGREEKDEERRHEEMDVLIGKVRLINSKRINVKF